MIFDFFGMVNNYENRKIGRYEERQKKILVSTASVSDSSQPFETAIAHPAYNKGAIIIVEMYDTKEKAEKGHKEWETLVHNNKLPKTLKDVSTSTIAEMCDAFSSDNKWRDKAIIPSIFFLLFLAGCSTTIRIPLEPLANSCQLNHTQTTLISAYGSLVCWDSDWEMKGIALAKGRGIDEVVLDVAKVAGIVVGGLHAAKALGGIDVTSEVISEVIVDIPGL